MINKFEKFKKLFGDTEGEFAYMMAQNTFGVDEPSLAEVLAITVEDLLHRIKRLEKENVELTEKLSINKPKRKAKNERV